MALSIQDDPTGKFSLINNAWSGQTTPAMLGLKGLSTLIPFPATGGSIAVGFDTRVSPGQVRVFFDIGNATFPGLGPNKFYGLVMSTEIRFDGIPVLPGVLSDAISYMDAYCGFVPSQGESAARKISPAYFINMRGKDELAVLGAHVDPYYAYNSLDATKFFSIENTCGWLAYQQPAVTTPNSPFCASLAAPIGIDLDRPAKSTLDNGASEMESRGAILAKGFLKGGNTVSDAINASKLDQDLIVKLQMYGSSPLITVADQEAYYPILYASQDTGNIYFLDINAINSDTYDWTNDLFDRFVDFNIANHYYSQSLPQREGYYTRSYNTSEVQRLKTVLSGGDHDLSVTYKVYCVGRGDAVPGSAFPYTYTCMNGVEWKVRRAFDKTSLRFGPLLIQQPKPMRLADVANYNREVYQIIHNPPQKESYCPGLSNYVNDNTIGTNPNQVQWLLPSPLLPASINGLSLANKIVFADQNWM